MYGRVRLTEDERQLRRSNEWRPAEGVELMYFGEGHASSVAMESADEQSPMSASVSVSPYEAASFGLLLRLNILF